MEVSRLQGGSQLRLGLLLLLLLGQLGRRVRILGRRRGRPTINGGIGSGAIVVVVAVVMAVIGRKGTVGCSCFCSPSSPTSRSSEPAEPPLDDGGSHDERQQSRERQGEDRRSERAPGGDRPIRGQDGVAREVRKQRRRRAELAQVRHGMMEHERPAAAAAVEVVPAVLRESGRQGEGRRHGHDEEIAGEGIARRAGGVGQVDHVIDRLLCCFKYYSLGSSVVLDFIISCCVLTKTKSSPYHTTKTEGQYHFACE